MKIVSVIPARYASTRFPGKPLASILGKPMIQYVYERVSLVQEIDAVYVATDDQRIFDAVKSFGGSVLMTSSTHTCGTDRLAECAEVLKICDEDLILNIQGDEPLIRPEMVKDLISIFDDKSVYMGTLKKKITEKSELNDPNIVKVVTDSFDDALYFSRYCIPYERNSEFAVHYKHVGAYGYTKEFLMKYSKMSKAKLEHTESLEQLRVLESGYKIRVKETNYSTIGVDTAEQLERVEERMRRDSLYA